MTVAINVWPSHPPPQQTLQNILPSYLYEEYADDDNVQAFITAYNTIAQQYVTWFNTINYPIYANNSMLAGPVLDWVAQSLYGMARPVLATGSLTVAGSIASDFITMLPIAGFVSTGSETVYATSDEVFKRILTWHLYKGDGRQFTIKWLKRRIMRFLYGAHGGDYIIDQTYPVSVTQSGSTVTITLTGTPALYATIFSAAIAQGVLEMPPFYSYVVNT